MRLRYSPRYLRIRQPEPRVFTAPADGRAFAPARDRRSAMRGGGQQLIADPLEGSGRRHLEIAADLSGSFPSAPVHSIPSAGRLHGAARILATPGAEQARAASPGRNLQRFPDDVAVPEFLAGKRPVRLDHELHSLPAGSRGPPRELPPACRPRAALLRRRCSPPVPSGRPR